MILLALACTLDTGTSEEPEPDWVEPVIHAAAYELTWDQDSFTRTDAGIRIETDLGYTVDLEAGVLSTYTVSLVACPTEEDTGDLSDTGTPAEDSYRSHGGYADDSVMVGPFTEDLAAGDGLDLGWTSFPEAAYCQVHVVMAASGERTLDLLGTIISPDGGVRALDLGTHLGHARLEDLQTTESFDDGHALVTVERRWDLDGIDLDALSDDDAAWEILSAISAGITLSVTAVADVEDGH